jgi:hypothetical protein
MPDHYCNVCKVPLCGRCHNRPTAPHNKEHDVDEFDYDNKVHTARAPDATQREKLDDGAPSDEDADVEQLTSKIEQLAV